MVHHDVVGAVTQELVQYIQNISPVHRTYGGGGGGGGQCPTSDKRVGEFAPHGPHAPTPLSIHSDVRAWGPWLISLGLLYMVISKCSHFTDVFFTHQ